MSEGRRAAVLRPAFAPSADRRSVLDRAHRGDIVGALGRVASTDTGPRLSWKARFATLAAVMGPGLVVMVADNDAGGISVYAQSGQNHGLGLLWLLVLLVPVLVINQEMVARLGAVTGAGHARLIFERFGRLWGWFALGDLCVLSVLTIVTEFIGVSLALGYFGVSRYIAVPVAGVALIAVTASGGFRRWERVMYVLLALNFAVVPLVLFAHSGAAGAAGEIAVHPTGGSHGALVLFVIALIGTTVAPWQLFFQQSNVVDKRITARWLAYERLDTLIGGILFGVGACAVLLTCAFAFGGTPLHGGFVDAGAVATGLQDRLGASAGVVFAIVLLNASVLGAAAVTLSTAYAIGDVLGVRHSLHRGWRDARTFHGSFAVCVTIGAAIVLVPGAPLGLVTTGVQALAGVLLPSACVFLLLLCNDKAVLGPWVNPRWLNALATLVVGVLIVLSALLTASTLFPKADVGVLAVGLAAVTSGAVGGVVVAGLRAGGSQRSQKRTGADDMWTMPPLESLPAPTSSSSRLLGLMALRVYLILAVVGVVIKVVELAIAG
ncbi:MAG TPA: NRAMP family divalent metal transporter [Solirubrobacteraceae bacterium]|nr:NRAMP family divalent metal transporter [Solirubrobacteraceae bacterium]